MIQVIKKADSVAQSFCISDEDRTALNNKLADIIEKWEKNQDVTESDVLLYDMMNAANNDKEQVYVAYQFGRYKELFEFGRPTALIMSMRMIK